MAPTIMHLQRLASYGVGFHSYTEPHLATDNELVRNILLALLAVAAVPDALVDEIALVGSADRIRDGCRLGRTRGNERHLDSVLLSSDANTEALRVIAEASSEYSHI